MRDADRPTTVRPSWVLLLALPLAGLALLLLRPELDIEWEHHPSHFWLVLVTAVVNVALAYVTNLAAGPRRADIAELREAEAQRVVVLDQLDPGRACEPHEPIDALEPARRRRREEVEQPADPRGRRGCRGWGRGDQRVEPRHRMVLHGERRS